MRKIFILSMIWSAVMTACSDGADRIYEDVSTPWEISMTVDAASESEFSFQVFRNGYLSVSLDEINWGDGKIETPGNMALYTHTYEQKGVYTIVVKGAGAILLKLSEANLTALDLTKCTPLLNLSCSKGKLTSLDLSRCVNLTNVVCSASLKELTLTGCESLVSLDCSKNNLEELSLPTSLTTFICSSNQLETLDLSANKNLKTVTCDKNLLKSLKVSGELTTLKCGSNKLTDLFVVDCPKLKTVSCEKNLLQEAAINTVYTALPQWASNTKGSITVYGNPSVGTVSIAEGKYWTVVAEKPTK